MEKLYVLSFDHMTVNPEALHQTIQFYAGTINWWHFLGFTYLITSTRSATEIQEYFHAQWPDLHFLVTDVTQDSNIDGWLPQDAWEWIINKRIKQNPKAQKAISPKSKKRKNE